MSVCVLDASFAVQWLFEDEASSEGDVALASIRAGGAAVPTLWTTEIANVLGVAERRGRVTTEAVATALTLLKSLDLDISTGSTLTGVATILDIMRRHRLTAYDATYLELAMRRGLPLATKDRELIAVAPIVGVALFTVAGLR